MPLPPMDVARGWMGKTLLDGNDDAAGRITDIYLDQDSGQPEWALVQTSRAGTRSTFVPLLDATAEGEAVRVPYSQATIDAAPSVEPDAELSQDDEERLYGHYGLAYSTAESNSGLPSDATAPAGTATEPVAEGTGSPDGPGLTPDGPGQPARRPRLRRYVPVLPASTPASEPVIPTAGPEAAPASSATVSADETPPLTVVDDPVQAPGTTPPADEDAPQKALPTGITSVLKRAWLLPVAGGLLAAVVLLTRRRDQGKRASRSSRLVTLARARSRRR